MRASPREGCDTVFVSDEFKMEGEEDSGPESKADIMVRIRKTNLAINWGIEQEYSIISSKGQMKPNRISLGRARLLSLKPGYIQQVMIRNSTHKYRAKYEGSLPKHIQSTTQLPHYSSTNLASNKTLSYLSRTPSQHKLQHLHNPPDNDFSLAMPEKWSDFKLKKKAMLRGSPTSKIENSARSRLRDSRQTQQEEKEEKKMLLKRDSEEFIESLPKNSVFFCSRCFQYVFQIEKKRHFPDCKDAVNLNERLNQAFQIMADRRIRNIIELSRYTGTRSTEMQSLYRLYEEGNTEKIEKIPFSREDFFTLQEIDQAFSYTFQQLLRGESCHKKSGIFNCF